jgi:hypothetical protein
MPAVDAGLELAVGIVVTEDEIADAEAGGEAEVDGEIDVARRCPSSLVSPGSRAHPRSLTGAAAAVSVTGGAVMPTCSGF